MVEGEVGWGEGGQWGGGGGTLAKGGRLKMGLGKGGV